MVSISCDLLFRFITWVFWCAFRKLLTNSLI